jgi:hypothetical protein
MSSVPPDAAPSRQPPIVGGFRFAPPTLVRVLVATMYLPALCSLGMAVMAARVEHDRYNLQMIAAAVLVVSGLVLALISFALGRGITHGSHDIWQLTVVLVVLVLLAFLAWVLPFWSVSIWAAVAATIVVSAIPVAVLALLLTPVVRQHCAIG